ncbi:MAG: MFS transporter [Candidatus Thorarchaeota archaeon]
MSTEEKLRYFQKIRLINRDAKLTVVSNMGLALTWGINDVVFNLYMLEAGFTEDFIGFFLSVSMFMTAAFAILAGMITDRRSRKKTLLIGTAVLFIATAFQYNTLSPLGLLFSQVLLGTAWAFLGVAWTPYTTSVTTEEERQHLFSVRFGFWVVANFLGYTLGGFLPGIWRLLGFAADLFWSYRVTLWIGLIPLAVSWFAIVAMREDVPQNGGQSWGFQNVKNWGFIGKYNLHWTLTGIGAGFFIMFLNIFFNQAFNADSATIGLIFGMNTVILAIGNFAYPVLVDRIGKTWTIIGSQTLSIPFLALLSWSPTLGIAALAYISRNVLMHVQLPVMDVFFMEGLLKEEQSTAMGIINTGDAVGRGISTNIGGWLLAAGMLRAPFAFAIAFYIIGVIVFYYYFGRRSPEPGQDLQKDDIAFNQSSEQLMGDE